MGFFGSGGGLSKIGSALSQIGDGLGYGMDYAMGNDRGVERFERNRDEAEARRLRMQQIEQLAASLAKQGLSPEQISMAMTNPEAIGSNFNQRFQPQKPVEPTAFQRNSEYLNSVQSGLGNTYLQNQADPLRFIEAQGPGGTKTLYPMRSGGAQPTTTPPPEYLTDDDFKKPSPGGMGGPDTGYNGQGAPTISQQEAQTVLQSMGGDQNRFQQWMRQHRVTIR